MEERVTTRRIRDLIRLLEDIEHYQQELLSLVRQSIDAMRDADVPAMRRLQAEQRAVLELLEKREGLRRQLMDEIGTELGLSDKAARALTVSQITERLSEPQQSAFLASARALRSVVFRVAQANRLAGVIARETVNHLKWVFAAVRPAAGAPSGYAGDGALVASADMRIFETVG